MTLSSCSSSTVATLASTQWKADAPTSADWARKTFCAVMTSTTTRCYVNVLRSRRAWNLHTVHELVIRQGRYDTARDLIRSTGPYRTGDALSFVDPFTGSGLLAAVKTGGMAGVAAARHEPMAAYVARCRAILKQPLEIARILREVVNHGWADRLAALIPGRLLFALTRPHQ